MPSVELRRAGDLAYRERVPEGPEAGPPVVLLHGYPESSRMWVPLMEALADAGRRSIAPDLYGLGDSADDRPKKGERRGLQGHGERGRKDGPVGHKRLQDQNRSREDVRRNGPDSDDRLPGEERKKHRNRRQRVA